MIGWIKNFLAKRFAVRLEIYKEGELLRCYTLISRYNNKIFLDAKNKLITFERERKKYEL